MDLKFLGPPAFAVLSQIISGGDPWIAVPSLSGFASRHMSSLKVLFAGENVFMGPLSELHLS